MHKNAIKYSRTSLNRTFQDRPKLFGLTDFGLSDNIYKEHVETGTSTLILLEQ